MHEFVFEWLSSIAHEPPAVLGKILFAAIAGGVLFWAICRYLGWFSKGAYPDRTAEVESLKAQVARHQETENQLTLALEEEKAQHHGVKDRFRQCFEAAHRFKKQRDEARNHRDQLLQQIGEVADTDGRIWEKLVPNEVPSFINPIDRSCRILSLMNLKGGVGKTTLAANIGYTLAREGDRVLLVDLDHQGSLTSLYRPTHAVKKIADPNKRFIRMAFEEAGKGVSVWDVAEEVTEAGLWLSPTDEALAVQEERVKAAWTMKTLSIDARMILRKLFHSRETYDQFDWIILDCPPRLTTASVNALACSDYLLVPVIVDELSIDAVPRMLRWISKLKGDGVKLCPYLQLAGIIASKTRMGTKLTTKENKICERLRNRCQSGVWHEPPYLFESFVPQRTSFSDCMNGTEFPLVACRESPGDELFKRIVKELRSRVPSHGRIKSERIHR